MTNPPTDEMVEAAARAIFIARKPKNMIPADWDSGALLGGKDDSYRHAILNQARAALEAALSHQGEVEFDVVLEGWTIGGTGSTITIGSQDGRKAVLRNDIGFTYTDRIVYDFLTALISKAEKV